MAEVRLESVTKIFDKQIRAVEQVSLEARDHEFLVLVGPSGCGKTTILRMIAGLEELSSGRIYIGGRLVNQEPPKDRGVAMVFQNYALYPHLTVYDNIAFGLRMAGTPKAEIEAKVKQTAAMLHLSGYLDRKPRALSGGQRQRVALARAIVKSPQVFLFDEPLSNLDAQLRTQTRAELKKLQQQLGTTAIYVTHDRVEAMTLGDRIAVMNQGRLQQIGEPLKIYDDPDNLFVADFMGSPGINKLRGAVVRKGRMLFFRSEAGTFPLTGPEGKGLAQPEVILGIRPEHLRIASGNRGLPASIELVEQLGGESLIYARGQDDTKLVAKVEGYPKLDRSRRIVLEPDPRALFLFHSQTGHRLRPVS